MATARSMSARCFPLCRVPRSSRTQAGALLCLIAVALACVEALADSPAGTDVLVPQHEVVPQHEPSFPVSQFVVQYEQVHPDQPELDSWLPEEVVLGVASEGYAAPRAELKSEAVALRSPGEVRLYQANALASVCAQLVGALQDYGLIGLYVRPHPSDIDPTTETDLRRPGDTLLRLIVSTGQLRRIRTIALGEMPPGTAPIDSQLHRRIRTQSPLQPAEDARDDTTDLMRKDLLEDYLHYLNRHPGRYVEAALAPGPDGQGVDLDFRINEAKPWQIFAQSSNTGTTHTGRWQSRVGFVHRQLTNRDDIFRLDYLNAGVDKVHSVNLSYEAPWFGVERPAWWKRSGTEPSWLSWFNRDRLPWWGANRLRWQIAGNYTRYKASNLQQPSSGTFPGYRVDGTDWNASASMIYNFYQHKNLFVDLVAGLAFRGVDTVNQRTQNPSNFLLLLPSVGLRLERQQELSTLLADLSVESSVLSIDEDDLANVGRGGANEKWTRLSWDLVASHYLEPLLYPKAWRDSSTPSTSTLAHELYLSARGQYSFGSRLIPQVTQVIGGFYSVRGYPQSTDSGDDLYAATVEYRFHLPRMLPIRRSPVQVPGLGAFRWTRQQPYGRADWDLILRLFSDIAYTRQNANDSSFAEDEFNQLLIGAGFGAELSIRNNFRVRFDYGWALRDSKDLIDPVKAGNNEIHLQFNILF